MPGLRRDGVGREESWVDSAGMNRRKFIRSMLGAPEPLVALFKAGPPSVLPPPTKTAIRPSKVDEKYIGELVAKLDPTVRGQLIEGDYR